MMRISVKMIVLLLAALTAFLVSGCGGESHTGQIADDLNLRVYLKIQYCWIIREKRVDVRRESAGIRPYFKLSRRS